MRQALEQIAREHPAQALVIRRWLRLVLAAGCGERMRMMIEEVLRV